jgi:hypothetical protein
LNLVEIEPGCVVVHYCGQQGKADLHPFSSTTGWPGTMSVSP